ncbi:unnamed protein product [Lathyrus sativus]|nr:unnamed protein product [Lathyrus sativus]
MAMSSVGNSSQSQIPVYGCNRAMRMFISNSSENHKRRFWKCANSGVMSNYKLFLWDDELERSISTEPKISIGCNCSEVMHELSCIIKDVEARKKEKMKLKLENERKKANLFRMLLILSWVLFFSYQKW